MSASFLASASGRASDACCAPTKANQTPRPRVAALTVVRDEPFFLPLWHRHYSAAFAADDLYCLHHVTSADEQADGCFAAALALFQADRVERLVCMAARCSRALLIC